MRSGERMPENWLECLPWNGDEKTLPLGGRIAVPNLKVTSFVKNYVVVRDDEMVTVGKKEIKKGDAVIDAIMDDDLYNRIIETYGERAVTIAKSGAVDKGLTRVEWKSQFNTDGLKLWALRDARMKVSGGGVHF